MRSFESLEKRELLTFIAQIAGTEAVYIPDGLAPAVDAAGNTYIGGRFQGTADFDPGPNTKLLSSELDSAFVASYDPQGALRWVRSFDFEGLTSGGNISNPYAMTTGLALGSDGSVHVTGRFSGSIDLMGEGNFVATQGESDVFIVKLDSENGAIGWAKTIGSSGSDWGSSIAVGDDGSVYVGGSFADTVDFDPGEGTQYLTSVAKRKNTSDGFILKLDASGDYQKAWNFGGSYDDRVYSLVLDVDGSSLFVGGVFRGTADFDLKGNDPDEERTSAGITDHYFASYTTSGEFRWAQSIGNADYVLGPMNLVASDSGLYLATFFRSEGGTELDIDPSSDSVRNVTGDGRDITFVAEYSKDGGQLLTDRFEPAVFSGDAKTRGSMVLDPVDGLYIGLSYSGSIDIDPGQNTIVLSDEGSSKSVVLNLDGEGKYVNHWQSGGYTASPVLGPDNSLHIVGNFNETATFPTGDTLTPSFTDIYLLGLTLSEPSEPPTADAGGPYAGVENVAVTFDASGSSDPDGDPLTYRWDFGDGQTAETTEATIYHEYAYGGEFTATLTVLDGTGNQVTDTAAVSITEVNDDPVADAGGPYSGYVDAPVTLDASGSFDFDNQDGTLLNDQTLYYQWDFGDGNTATTDSPANSHPFAATGDYTITLTVSDGVSTSSPVVTTVSITDPPAGDPNVIYVSDISFESTARGKNTDWRVVITIRRDSNADGFGTSSDAVVANAQVTVTFNGQTFTGQTDFNGIFRTSYVRNLGSGNHVAEVTDAVFGSYEWNPLMVVDLDGDGIPDDDLDSDDADLYPEAVLTL